MFWLPPEMSACEVTSTAGRVAGVAGRVMVSHWRSSSASMTQLAALLGCPARPCFRLLCPILRFPKTSRPSSRQEDSIQSPFFQPVQLESLRTASETHSHCGLGCARVAQLWPRLDTGGYGDPPCVRTLCLSAIE